MESQGWMIPDPKINSLDPSFSSDFMITDQEISDVADGVSQWKKYYINPRVFGQKLLTNVRDIKKSLKQEFISNLIEESIQILQQAFEKVQDAGSVLSFSISQSSKLQILLELENSQALVLHRNKNNYEVLYQTKVDQYTINTPRQLIRWPNSEFVKKLKKKNQELGLELAELIEKSKRGKLLKAKDAKHYDLQIQNDDLIICGSDGFFDNMWIESIVEIVNKQKQIDLQKLSKKLFKKA